MTRSLYPGSEIQTNSSSSFSWDTQSCLLYSPWTGSSSHWTIHLFCVWSFLFPHSTDNVPSCPWDFLTAQLLALCCILESSYRVDHTIHLKAYRLTGASDMLLDLKKEPSGKFKNFFRMSAEEFEYLLNEIGPKIWKCDTNMRKTIPVKESLAVTLWFLANGNIFTSIWYLFIMLHQPISCILPEVCKALIEVLENEIKVRGKNC